MIILLTQNKFKPRGSDHLNGPDKDCEPAAILASFSLSSFLPPSSLCLVIVKAPENNLTKLGEGNIIKRRKRRERGREGRGANFPDSFCGEGKRRRQSNTTTTLICDTSDTMRAGAAECNQREGDKEEGAQLFAQIRKGSHRPNFWASRDRGKTYLQICISRDGSQAYS